MLCTELKVIILEKVNFNTVLRKAAKELKLEWHFKLWEERPLQMKGQQRHSERSRREGKGALKVLPESPGDGEKAETHSARAGSCELFKFCVQERADKAL